MDHITIVPIGRPLDATVVVPGSKSLTNRALVIAALSDGPTLLTNALEADDTARMADSLERLGFSLRAGVSGTGTVLVEGLGGLVPARSARLDAGNAGTAARFLAALVSLGSGDFVIDGGLRMRERPIADLVDGLRQLGVAIECPSGCPPVRVRGAGLAGGTVVINGDTSSQFVSALLVAAPCARSPVEIVMGRPLASSSFVDMTLAVMSDFGVEVARDGYRRFSVPCGRYRAQARYAVESDATAASYFFAAAAVAGGTVRVERISRRSRQGDIAFLDVLAAMGCRVEESGGGIQVSGPRELRGLEVDMSTMPDTAQTLAVVAPFACSPTAVSGIASARLKECDRIAATCRELARLGVEVEERADGFVIQPCPSMHAATIRTYDDHRMAMAFAIAGLRVPGVSIEHPSCVSKTFPSFFDTLDRLRAPGRPRAAEAGPIMNSRLRFLTAGESHGPALVAILEGMPAGLPLGAADLEPDLARRRGAGPGGRPYPGASPRMTIEHDPVEILGGVMDGVTTGAPIAVQIRNRDHEHWQGRAISPMTVPRPGHADLAGAAKYGYTDLQVALERASARETAARVAVGAICRKLLAEFGISVGSYVVEIGGVEADLSSMSLDDRLAGAMRSVLSCPSESGAAEMSRRISEAAGTGDTLGGVFDVIASGLPPGLGSHVHWDRRLTARLAAALLGIPALKGVEIGEAFANARRPGTAVHDEIGLADDGVSLVRRSNRAGGLEGGITNGLPLVVRAAMKPLASTATPVQSVDLATGAPSAPRLVRSDVCAVPRAAVVGEAMVCVVIADALLEKLGGDSLAEMTPRFRALRRPRLDELPMRPEGSVLWP